MGGGVGGEAGRGSCGPDWQATAINTNIVATPCRQTVSWLVVSSLGLLCLGLAVPGCSLAFLALAYPWMLCAYQAALGCFQAAF